MLVPEIDRDKCDGCGLCIGICLPQCLVMVNNTITFVGEVECDWCTQCEAICAAGAIRCPFEVIFE